MEIVIVFGVLMVAIGTVSSNESYTVTEEEWNLFKISYNKSYSHENEESYRKSVYSEKKLKIERHNELFANGKVSYTMGMNQFGDMTFKEFLETMTGLKPNLIDISTNYTPVSFKNVSHAKNVNWVEKGYVTPVKNQGGCGSCWAFSATGTLEGQIFKKSHKLISLSEQNLMDCSWKVNNYGCHGGWPISALAYIKYNGGIDTEKSYPYTGMETKECKFNSDNVGAKVTDVHLVERGDENLLGAVSNVGPISVAIEVNENFQSYKNGVYDSPCSSTINHAVLVVGYDAISDGKNYWIVKNSWGPEWGNKGYILMSRNDKNFCFISDYAVYPEV